MQTRIVAIVPTGPNQCRAIPAHVHVDAGDEINWINLTGDEITIFFPSSARVLAAPPANDVAPGIGHGKKADENANFAVKARGGQNGLRDGSYPFSVHCKLTNNFAEGDSASSIEVP